jgi:hypothetical protein
MSLDEALQRLAQVRIEIERHESDVWCLEREADELRARVRFLNAQPVTEKAA